MQCTIANICQIDVGLPRIRCEQVALEKSVYIGRRANIRIGRNRLAYALREERMPVRPIVNSFKQLLSFGCASHRRFEALCQHQRFLQRKIAQINSFADVERSRGGAVDQVAWNCNPKKAKRKPLIRFVVNAPVIALANRGEEFICAERQRPSRVDLIEEHHQR